MSLPENERPSVRSGNYTGNGQIYSMAISPDGQRIAVDIPSGPTTSELRIVERGTGQVRTVFTSKASFRVVPMDWSQDGRTLG